MPLREEDRWLLSVEIDEDEPDKRISQETFDQASLLLDKLEEAAGLPLQHPAASFLWDGSIDLLWRRRGPMQPNVMLNVEAPSLISYAGAGHGQFLLGGTPPRSVVQALVQHYPLLEEGS